MIRLIGVLTEGGVPIDIKSDLNTKGDVLVGALIEAARSLSQVVGSGEVKKLDFNEKKLIVTESEKGYTVVALVERAEDYIDILVRIIAEEIDKSDISRADGFVGDEHKRIVDEILDAFVRHEVKASVIDVYEKVWLPIRANIQQRGVTTPEMPKREQSNKKWARLKGLVSQGLDRAVEYAKDGDFDKACAASINENSIVGRIFCIKMGALALSMTKTIPPDVNDLIQLAERLPKDDPFSQFANAIIKRIRGNITQLDYTRALKRAIEYYQFYDSGEEALLAFLFVDTSVANHPEFASRIIQHMQNLGFTLAANYVAAILERSTLFSKLYSITSYNEFRDEIGVWKHQIKEVIEGVEKVLKYRRLKKVLKRGEANAKGQTGSMKLQNYITLLTAMAESPVLTIAERKEVLEEVLDLYERYVRRLLKTDVPLFAYTVDSVFQSLGVANAEYFYLITGTEREAHAKRVKSFLQDMLDVIDEELGNEYISFAGFVVSNVVFPALLMMKQVENRELEFVATMMKSFDPRDAEALKIVRPMGHASTLSNMASTLASLVPLILTGEERANALRVCLKSEADVHMFLLSQGMVCRDDIMAFTYHVSQAVDDLSEKELRDFLRITLALNRVAIQDPKKYDYEVAMMGDTLLDLLMRSWQRLGDQWLRSYANESLEVAISAWRKYGFEEHARRLEQILKIMRVEN